MRKYSARLLFVCCAGLLGCGETIVLNSSDTSRSPAEGDVPSCEGLAKTCGPDGVSDCCASSVVSGGTFFRSDLGSTYPATVSDFRLDTYEITVGRFRKFVANYTQNMTADGAGRNPNNLSDPGWDAGWNTDLLPATQAQLTSEIQCDALYHPWTTSNDALAMNCLNWFVAEAFCIWDGGRLPTEAEWNYAAAGGAEAREYPWGSAPPDCSYANFSGRPLSALCVDSGPNRVGSESPKGDGRYGQADLAGNVGEWVQDWFAGYPAICDNCADTTVSVNRALRGGGFGFDPSYLVSSYRFAVDPSVINYSGGGRCARNAP